MPSLFRFLLVLGVLGAIAWGGMVALVTYVEPQQRDMQHSLPASKLTR
ncbi:MAG: histidine kinase [Alphaproteobacteria bacterium]|nr:histidine kinase [Alphaproteobacteria bacterium]